MNKEGLSDWIKDNKGKVIAIFISFLYLSASFVFGQEGDWIKMLMFLILPLACIFLSDAMGGYTGMSNIGIAPHITRSTPGCFVALAGWVLLLFPLLFAIFRAIIK